MKFRTVLIVIIFTLALLSGCRQQSTPNAGTTTAPTGTTPAATQASTLAPSQTTATTTPDAVSSASIVDNATAFENAISRNGTWIIAITKDLTVDKDLTLDGDFKNGKKDDAGNEIIQRKIALYSQDENRNITARYTLTAPKLTINSLNGSIQHGTFKGDVYVSAQNFQLIDATVDGNVYFTTAEAKNTFKADDKSKVTGKQEMAK